MARQPGVCNKNGYWYSEAGGVPRYYGRADRVSRAEAMSRLWGALAGRGTEDAVGSGDAGEGLGLGRRAAPAASASASPQTRTNELTPAVALSVNELADRFLTWVRTQRGAKAHAERSRHLRRFRVAYGDRDAISVDGSQLEGFQAALRGDGHAAEYVKKHADTVRMMYAHGVRHGWLPAGFAPFRHVEPIRRTPRSLSEGDLPTVAEVQALLASADPDMADMIRVYHATGARTAELFSARVADFQPTTRQIVLARHKRTHTLRIPVARAIALNDTAFAIVQRRCDHRPADALIHPNADGGEFTNMTIAKRFRTIRRRAGVRDTITIYSFRHLWVSEAVMAGVDVLLVARMAGTSVAMIERVYGHFRAQSYADAQARLDAARRAQG